MNPVAIIDYGAGNLRSIQKAFEHLGYQATFTSNPVDLTHAPAIIFPGQGASPPAMKALERDGMASALRSAIGEGIPFFGVCLGLQLLLESSEEGFGNCLGLVKGKVKHLSHGVKVPHMGWNSVKLRERHPVFEGVPENRHFYFVHSYYAEPTDDSWIVGTTTYGSEFASVLAKGNLIATQFHPEKSGMAGLMLYDNFMKYLVGTD